MAANTLPMLPPKMNRVVSKVNYSIKNIQIKETGFIFFPLICGRIKMDLLDETTSCFSHVSSPNSSNYGGL